MLYWGYPANNVLIISSEQQRGSAVHIHVSVLPQTPLPSRLPHNTEQSSLCCTAGQWMNFFNAKENHKNTRKKYINNFKVGKEIFKTGDLKEGITLVVQWRRTCPPIQGTWIGSQVREDCTCLGAAEACAPQLLSTCAAAHDACALEPMTPALWSPWRLRPGAHAPQAKPPQWEAGAPLGRVTPARRS